MGTGDPGRQGAQGELAFDLKGSAQLKLAPDASRSELKDVALAGSLSEPTQRLDAFSLKADRLALGQWSSLTLSLQGHRGRRTSRSWPVPSKEPQGAAR